MISHSLKETEDIAKGFTKDLISHGTQKKATLVGLYGDLGSGKTTFTQMVADIFGVKETVTSPTFIIEKIYKTQSDIFPKFIHIDAYRLDSGEDLKKLGFEKILEDSEALIFIEWPERVAEILPEHTRVMCEFVSKKERTYEIIF